MTELKLVDLGTKLGSAIVEFRKRGHIYFGGNVSAIRESECLGIDLRDKFGPDLTRRGYQFQALDLTAPGVLQQLPEADYYLAWDFLEHLPSKEWADAVVAVMLHKSRRGVWLRMPSFEQDAETGEGVLRNLGLRFTWTNWVAHKAHYLVKEALLAVQNYEQQTKRKIQRIDVRPGLKIRSTDDYRVVPVDAPVDTLKYSVAMGVKSLIDFNPPVVGQWEVLIHV